MSDPLLLTEDLLLASLSGQHHPKVSAYKAVEAIDLSQLNNVDSAGVAYLVQIKIQYPSLELLNASAKLQVLAQLYGVEYIFETNG
jgi:phospholipid transport system transporter-binding protein